MRHGELIGAIVGLWYGLHCRARADGSSPLARHIAAAPWLITCETRSRGASRRRRFFYFENASMLTRPPPPENLSPTLARLSLRGSPFRRSTRMLDERRAYKRRAPQRMLDRHAMVATPTSADSASLARGRSRSSQKALPWFASSSYRYFINNRQPKGGSLYRYIIRRLYRMCSRG